MKGFSPRNLKYMRRFAEVYQNERIVQEVLAQIPWYHHITILDKVKEPDARDFYIQSTISRGWSSMGGRIRYIESEFASWKRPDGELGHRALDGWLSCIDFCSDSLGDTCG